MNRFIAFVIFSFLLAACQQPTSKQRYFYVELQNFNKEYYQYISEHLFERWTDYSLLDNLDKNELLRKEDKAEMLKNEYTQIHFFKEFHAAEQNSLPENTLKFTVKLNETENTYSVRAYKLKKGEWVRVLNAGNFNIKPLDNKVKMYCEPAIRSVVALSYK